MDHISIPIADAARSRTLYTACLAPLGWTERGFVDGRYVGYHRPGEPVLYFGVATRIGEVHLALRADTPEAVRAFYDRALAAGATDHGPPGLRPGYGPDYYAAFVRDPDGHNIEAVVGGVR